MLKEEDIVHYNSVKTEYRTTRTYQTTSREIWNCSKGDPKAYPLSVKSTVMKIVQKKDRIIITHGVSELRKILIKCRFFSKEAKWTNIVIRTDKGLVYYLAYDKGFGQKARKKLYVNTFRLTENISRSIHLMLSKPECKTVLKQILNINLDFQNDISAIYYPILWFMNFHGCKLPNHWAHLLRYQPPLKFIRSESTFQKAILKYHNAYCKFTNHAIQEKKTNPTYLIYWYKILGRDFISQLSPKVYDNVSTNMENKWIKPKFHYPEIKLTNQEKQRVVRLSHIIGPDEMFDHIRLMIQYETLYGEPWKLRATTQIRFVIEHRQLTKAITKAENAYFELKFKDRMVQEIEKPINDFTPILLKNTDEYMEEGEHQHHCVFGYRDMYEDYCIISLRKGDYRITCSFDYKGIPDQIKSKYNKNPEDPEVQLLIDRIGKLKLKPPTKENQLVRD